MPRRVEASEATPVTVPYEADFSVSGDAMDEDFIIINNNEDESDSEPCTWKWSAGNGAYYLYNEDGVTPADDYLVLPVILKGGTTYDVVVNAASWNYPEEFEVVAGTECSAAGLTTTVIDKTVPENEAADYSGTFTPASDGVYSGCSRSCSRQRFDRQPSATRTEECHHIYRSDSYNWRR